MKNKALKIIVLLLIVALISVVVIFVIGNSYDFEMRDVKIPIQEGELNAKIAMPEAGQTHGVIVVVHGDGAVNATADEYYKPAWEVMVDAGYAIISWDKQGVGGSSGNWLKQSMADRAGEVLQVIQWVKAQDQFDKNNIGIWGTSQAGWVIPTVVGKTNVAFCILCAPAINWVSQGEYHLAKSMEQEGKTQAEIEAAVESYKEEVKLLDSDISYNDYISFIGDEGYVSEDRFDFIKRNYRADATADLCNFEIPVLLVLGGQDIKVDSQETLRVYEEQVPEEMLHVEWIENTNHSMLKEEYINKSFTRTITFILSPTRIISKDYLLALTRFIENTY